MPELLVLFDTDEGVEDRLRSRLDDEGIADLYKVRRLNPKTTVSPDAMVNACLHEFSALFPLGVAAVFIDLVIREGKGDQLDVSGVALGQALRRDYPLLPLFCITRYFKHDNEAAALSEATVVEELDGVLLKTYLESSLFSAARLKALLRTASTRRAMPVAARNLAASSSDPLAITRAKATFGANIDARVQLAIYEVGDEVFWSIIGNLFPDGKTGALHYLSPGRSGAHVFRARVQHELSRGHVGNARDWLVKIARDADAIRREAAAYSELPRTGISKASFPQLLSAPTWCGETGGFVAELQTGCSHLGALIQGQHNDERCERFLSSLLGAIGALHGRGTQEVQHVWTSSFALDRRTSIAATAFLKQHSNLIRLKTSPESLDCTLNFLQTDGRSVDGLLEHSATVIAVYGHNDLNSGNVLVAEDGSAVLIDFGSTGVAHAAKDFAKLDRDLFFRLDGYGSDAYYSWVTPSRALRAAQGKLPDRPTPADRRMQTMRSGLRRAFVELQGSAQVEYTMALLSYSLSALANESLPTPRRVAGVEFCAEIIRVLIDQLSE